jgi:hypothetical protein
VVGRPDTANEQRRIADIPRPEIGDGQTGHDRVELVDVGHPACRQRVPAIGGNGERRIDQVFLALARADHDVAPPVSPAAASPAGGAGLSASAAMAMVENADRLNALNGCRPEKS